MGARYNRAHGELAGITGDVGANRWQFGGGWFVTPNVLAKVEYVNQKYFGYPADEHQERWKVQRDDARRRHRLLTVNRDTNVGMLLRNSGHPTRRHLAGADALASCS